MERLAQFRVLPAAAARLDHKALSAHAKAVNSDFESRLKSAQAATDAALAQVLADAPGAHPWPERLRDAMRYAVLGPGKRLRPFLLIESARLLGAMGNGVVRAAAALECVHCYSLVHDDLPAMDDDDLRRGRPTVHKAYDEATAILVGDALQTLAFAMLADPATDSDAEVRLALITGLAKASGAGGMAGGQMLDMVAERQMLNAREIGEMQAMKTGALFSYACEAGALIGRASADNRARLAAFGAQFGLVFQLADDLIDAEGAAGTAGKATAKDASRGKATLVGLNGAAQARLLLREAVERAVATLAPFGAEGALLADAARFAGRRDA
jgi:farnesyl diphosphate synthase